MSFSRRRKHSVPVRRVRRVLAPLTAASVLATAAFAAVAPSSAFASIDRWYCTQTLVGYQQASSNFPNACPPAGSSQWTHLTWNYGNGQYYVACIDEYLDPNNNGHYTGQTCASPGTYTQQTPSSVWGFPRIWNGYCCAADADQGAEAGN
jgi:hypothetical protein